MESSDVLFGSIVLEYCAGSKISRMDWVLTPLSEGLLGAAAWTPPDLPLLF